MTKQVYIDYGKGVNREVVCRGFRRPGPGLFQGKTLIFERPFHIGELMGVISDFSDFLEEYKVMSLAIAFIIGTALTAMVQSLVNNVIMPIIGIFLPMGDWQGATVTVGER